MRSLRMLVLKRRLGEVIVVDDQTRVTVLGFRGDSVSLGIEAPPKVSVHRLEIWEKLRKLSDDVRRFVEPGHRLRPA